MAFMFWECSFVGWMLSLLSNGILPPEEISFLQKRADAAVFRCVRPFSYLIAVCAIPLRALWQKFLEPEGLVDVSLHLQLSCQYSAYRIRFA